MNNNYCIIMSGGIGSRFWPFSRTDLPKQFLDFFGTGRTLLQMTYDRFARIMPAENIFIVTNAAYAELTLKQLPQLTSNQLLLEPQRRNTAPCIAWASYHIRAIDPNANIVVAPSDHLILKEADFLEAIKSGLDFVSREAALLTLGITPNRPETGYGYIQMDPMGSDEIRRVKTFTEKPNLELAKVFVESGEFLWNAGIFLWNVNTIIDAFHQYLPEITDLFDLNPLLYNTPQEALFIETHFPTCPNISIDFGIMEKASNVFVLRADVGWSDLGTWGSLYDLSAKDEHQNVSLHTQTLAYNSEENIIVVPHKLVVTKDLNKYIVVESKNVLLICPQESEQQIRQFVADAKRQYGEEYI